MVQQKQVLGESGPSYHAVFFGLLDPFRLNHEYAISNVLSQLSLCPHLKILVNFIITAHDGNPGHTAHSQVLHQNQGHSVPEAVYGAFRI